MDSYLLCQSEGAHVFEPVQQVTPDGLLASSLGEGPSKKKPPCKKNPAKASNTVKDKAKPILKPAKKASGRVDTPARTVSYQERDASSDSNFRAEVSHCYL